MRCCDLNTGLARIQRASGKLKERWLEVKAHWNDAACRRFEKEFLQPLPSEITLVAAAVYQLRDLVEQAEKELEDDPTAH